MTVLVNPIRSYVNCTGVRTQMVIIPVTAIRRLCLRAELIMLASAREGPHTYLSVGGAGIEPAMPEGGGFTVRCHTIVTSHPKA